VAFGEHRMMLRPRDDCDQNVLQSELEITPKPSELTWTRDVFGNHVATARFARRAATLRFESHIRLERAPTGFRKADIEDIARTYPFADRKQNGIGASCIVAPSSTYPAVDRWAASFLRSDGSADTHDLLVDVTKTINRSFKHVARHEKGIQSPDLTLQLKSGSCRDFAMLMIAALRSLGFATRFVSGYLYYAGDDHDDDDVEPDTGGNTHAWVQVYVPGPGWVDFDPSSGTVAGERLVRVAVVHEPSEAIPLLGSWIGAASDHLAMKVAVKVTAEAGGNC
jgi:transglutaminase-like putative cysteine protease